MNNFFRNQSVVKRLRFQVSAAILSGLILSMSLFSSFISHKPRPVKKNAEPPLITLKVQKIADSLEAVTDMAFPGNGEVWITEQLGKILVLKNGKIDQSPLLDLRSKMLKINNGYEERGLLGITLSPQFSTNKKFYVFYSRPYPRVPGGVRFDHTDVIAEYQLPASGQVDPNSGRIILTANKPDGNHDGGCLKFGPDGYLYISFGDGGGQHDKHGPTGNGQNLNTLLGKILRIDVNSDSTYVIPKDNPFVGKADAKPEIWAYGFRNPYRFSFDKVSKQLFAGDVGQDLWEEVDIVKKGANYGWKIVEGTHCHNDTNTPTTGCVITGITMPITEYSHKEGISVIGGYIYNGQQLPALKNKYFFTDWTGPVFYLQKVGSNWQRGKITLQNIPPNLKITGINEDQAGELYVLTNPDTGPGNTKCAVYKIVKN
jgi:glucose/arabinose dehydrogenase